MLEMVEGGVMVLLHPVVDWPILTATVYNVIIQVKIDQPKLVYYINKTKYTCNLPHSNDREQHQYLFKQNINNRTVSDHTT
jgi:hypothetical protein